MLHLFTGRDTSGSKTRHGEGLVDRLGICSELKLLRNNWIFVAIGALALLLRLAPLLRPGSDWLISAHQADQYIALARGLHFGCGFARLVDGTCLEPEQLRTPGYPVFLSLIPTVRYTVAVQALIGAAICLMIGQFTRRRWGLPAGAMAAALLAIDPPSIVVCGAIFIRMPISSGDRRMRNCRTPSRAKVREQPTGGRICSARRGAAWIRDTSKADCISSIADDGDSLGRLSRRNVEKTTLC